MNISDIYVRMALKPWRKQKWNEKKPGKISRPWKRRCRTTGGGRTVFNCEDPEEKALWKELLDWENKLSDCAALIRRTPMPSEINDIVRTRASLHISQRIVFHHFLELLFENCLRKNDDENLNLLFAFLEDYSNLLEKEAEWCGT